MGQPEALASWRLYCCNWLVVGVMAAALIAGMALAGFSFAPASTVVPFAIAGAYIAYSFYSYRHPRKRDPLVVFTLGSTGQILLIPILMTPMTYVAASANLPMQDVALDAIDRALGLHWMAYYQFVSEHHALLVLSVWSYSMIGWPVFGVPIALGWTGRYARLQTFTLAFAIALAVTTAVSAVVPAMGTYDLLKFLPDPNLFVPGGYTEQLRDLPLVRDGSLRYLHLSGLTGIVTFPSFHAAAAVLYIWAFWPVRWIGPLAAIVNIAMLLATPIVGGHYFIDLFAGGAIAAASIMAAQFIAQKIKQPRERAPAAAAPAMADGNIA
jgi:membrane-associated phospholipid phosphatase